MTGIRRLTLPSARADRLYFAQVREDPRVELTALRLGRGDRVVVVSSGGCTALSLLAAGAAEVHAVDMNRTQNDLTELKAIVARRLPRGLIARLDAIAFLGGSPMSRARRLSIYDTLRLELTPGARAYWDAHEPAIARGVIGCGVSERFIGLVAFVVRHIVHTPARVRRLLACQSLEEQRALFATEWNTRRWRWLFSALLNRWSMSRAYDSRFFTHVGRRNFAEHFLQLANHALTEIPVADNYFLHQMLGGRYVVERRGGVPPYLDDSANSMGSLVLVDGGMTEYLRTLPDGSIDALALSNIGEWLDAAGNAALFREVERVAAPGARIVFRNFVGWTELPGNGSRLREDPTLGAELIRSDRSVVQSRVVVCHTRGGSDS